MGRKKNSGTKPEKKTPTKIRQVEVEGLTGFVGKRLTLFGLNYIYTGTVTGVNDKYVLLHDAAIVYETGPLCDKVWQDKQNLPHPVYVVLSAVESFMALKE